MLKMKKPRLKSCVWNYFERIEETRVGVCNYCKMSISFNATITNLKGHLRRRHYTAYLECRAASRADSFVEASSSTNSINSGKRRPKKQFAPLKAQSVFAKHFGIQINELGKSVSKTNVTCMLCSTSIYFNGVVDNLKTHVKNEHPNDFNDEDFNNLTNITSMQFDQDPTNITLIEEGDQPSAVQTDSQEQNSEMIGVSIAISEFIISDLQLPEVVESLGFQNLIATLRSPCEIPSKLKLTDDIIQKLFSTYRSNILENLAETLGSCSLSVEEWHSASGNIYVTFSVHFQMHIVEDQVKTAVLETFLCSEEYDSTQWQYLVTNLLKSWNLNEPGMIKAVIIATGQDSLLTALRCCGFTVIPCIMHTLQSICMKGCFALDLVEDVVKRIRLLLALIYRNRKAVVALRFQEALRQIDDDTPLVADYPKIWISTYMMMERLLSRRSIMDTVLEGVTLSEFEEKYMKLTEKHWSVIKDVVTVLEPFQVITNSLTEEKTPLLSLVKPLLWQLTNIHLKAQDTDSTLAKELKSTLSSMLKDKYSEEGVNTILKTATTLDPRFKRLPFAVEESKQMLNGSILVELSQLISDDNNSNAIISQSSSTPEINTPKSGMKYLLGNWCTEQTGVLGDTSSTSATEKASLEISLYGSERIANLDHCPLAWWQTSKPKFSYLAKLASRYNCMPATAIPTARLPFNAQVLFDAKRGKLSPEIVDMFIFLNGNYNLFGSNNL